jgi:hypothetical protein
MHDGFIDRELAPHACAGQEPVRLALCTTSYNIPLTGLFPIEHE